MFRETIMPGITLAQVMPPDAPELFRLVDRERPRLAPRFPWVDATRTITDTRTFIAESMARFGRGDGTDAMIREGTRIIGVIGALAREPAPRTFEIGYWLTGEHEGRGIVGTAGRWLVERAFSVFGAERLVIRAAVDNARSRTVAIRLGFREEATLIASGMLRPPEDLVIHTMHRRDWLARGGGRRGGCGGRGG